MFELEETKGGTLLPRSIDCPISWCEGEARTHGADGSAPEEWEHHGPTVPLLPGGLLESRGWAARAQFGSGPAGWTGSVEVLGDLFEQGPATVVEILRSAADELERNVRHEQDVEEKR